MPGQTPLEIIEGHYLALILDAFLRVGLLDLLRTGASVEQAADLLVEDEATVLALLEFTVESSRVIERPGPSEYRLAPDYRSWSSLPFHLHKFVGAYGPAVAALGSRAVHIEAESRLAQAYDGLSSDGRSLVGMLLGGAGVDGLLDLGCGPARLLVELARQNPGFHGWGVDRDPAMCRAAEQRIQRAGLDDRLLVQRHDCADIEALPIEGADNVHEIHAGNVLNEFFWPSDTAAVALLSALRRRFPGRRLFVSDYYGQLTSRRRIGRAYRQTLLQDLAQAVSTQGVPPPDRDAWITIYARSGVSLTDVVEGTDNGVRWFVHTVAL